jgi:hypothetical protein
MADCFHHGQSLPGLCPDCERAQNLNLAPEQVPSTVKPIPMEERYEKLGALYLAQLSAAETNAGR